MSHPEGHYNKQERNGGPDRRSMWDSLRRLFSPDKTSEKRTYTAPRSRQDTLPSTHDEAAEAAAAKAKETRGISIMLFKLLFLVIIQYVMVFMFAVLISKYNKQKSAKEEQRRIIAEQEFIRNQKKAQAIAARAIEARKQEIAKIQQRIIREQQASSRRRQASSNEIRFICNSDQLGETADIRKEAYMDCRKLHQVKMKCRSIGRDAFRGCYELETVAITGNLTAIQSGAFAECFSLTSLLLPKTLREIGDNILERTRNVREISLPYHVRTQFADKLGNISGVRTLYILTDVFFKMPEGLANSGLNRLTCTLYVPDAMYIDFLKDPDWILFGEIEPLSKSKHYDARGGWKE